MRVLSVIVCHNFYYYLRNTLESLLEYFPLGDVLVVDNGSTDSRLIEYLNHKEISEPRVKVVFRGENNIRRKVGSLYEAYNLAIDHAIDREYDYLHLMADDVQYMWTDEQILDKVDHIFKSLPQVLNVSAFFFRQVGSYNLDRRFNLDARSLGYKSLDYGVADDGFFRVKTLVETKFKFLDSEGLHGKIMLDRGYNRFQLRDPFIAEIPWPATRRGGKIIGKEGPPRERYYLKPLDQDQITALQARPIQEYPYLEDYCFPWGYACLTPIWVTNPSIEYIESLITRRIKAKKSILIPHFEMRGMTPNTGSIPLIWNAARILRYHEPSLFLWLKLLSKEQAVRPLRVVRRLVRWVLRLRRSWAPSQ